MVTENRGKREGKVIAVQGPVVDVQFTAIEDMPDEALDAYQLCARGLHYLHRMEPAANLTARDYFERAVARRPT